VSGASTDRHDASSVPANAVERIAVVTGATGFIGRHVCRALRDRGWHVRGTVRSLSRAAELPTGVEPVRWDLEQEEAPATLVHGASVVVHLAGRAHRMGGAARHDSAAYQRLNVGATRSLLRSARATRVARFIYVSSIKVLGEGETSPYGADAPLDPRDAYATSKADAETVVRLESGPVRWTIVRPAFVYGASGRGNFVRLVKLARVASRIPLPLSGIHNRRSVVYVENLADLLAFCAESDRCTGQVIPGVDTQSVSTPALLRAVAASLGLRARLYSVPTGALSLVARLVGRSPDWRRVSGDFEVDTSIHRRIGWRPPISFDESFRRCAASIPADAPA
jgi:nucleoside-diphosphate-sugar epimerase